MEVALADHKAQDPGLGSISPTCFFIFKVGRGDVCQHTCHQEHVHESWSGLHPWRAWNGSDLEDRLLCLPLQFRQKALLLRPLLVGFFFFFFFLIRKRFWPLHCRLQAFSGCGVRASRCRGFPRC